MQESASTVVGAVTARGARSSERINPITTSQSVLVPSPFTRTRPPPFLRLRRLTHPRPPPPSPPPPARSPPVAPASTASPSSAGCSVRVKRGFWLLLTMTTLRCSHYTFYIHIVNEFSILSSGATSPRVGGLIDSRRHVRAESAAVQHSLGAGEEPFFFRMTDSSHPLRGSALFMRAGWSLGFTPRRTLESERPGSCRHHRCGAV